MRKITLFIIYSVGAFLLAGYAGKILAPSTTGEQLVLVWVSVLLSLIVGLLGVMLQEISNLKK